MKYYQRSLWPNLITFGNIFLGFFAIVLFSQERFLAGSWLIVIAAIFDGMDGAVARLVKSSSKFGVEVDSLADTVSFGVAPAVLVYFMLPESLGWSRILLGALPLLTAVTRLARYNILTETTHSRIFSGMPTPSAAMLFVGFYIFARNEQFDFNTGPVWVSLTMIVSLLMIAPIPYRRLPVVQLHGVKRPWLSVLALVIVAIALLIDTSRSLFPMMVIYLLVGPIEWIVVHSGVSGAESSFLSTAFRHQFSRRPFFPRRRK